MSRPEIYGRPKPVVKAGHWAQIKKGRPKENERVRCYVESIHDGVALLRFVVTTDDGQPWPFPLEIEAPVDILLPAPRPKFVEVKA
jgi:hypothetical protein